MKIIPKIGDILIRNFKNPTVETCDWICVQSFVDKDIYILQNQITGQIEQYTSDQLLIYFHLKK